MASRRTRIKGIANIPQRKKPVPGTETLTSNDVKLELLEEINKNDNTKENENATEAAEAVHIVMKQEDQDINASQSKSKNEDVKLEKDNISSNAEIREVKYTETSLNSDQSLSCKIVSASESERKIPDLPKLVPIVRRKFLKPGINLNLIKHRNAIKEENSAIEADAPSTSHTNLENGHKCDKVIVLSEVRIPKAPNSPIKVARDITKMISDSVGDSKIAEITLNEAHFHEREIAQPDNSSAVTFSPIKKFGHEPHISDTEYPAPPPSPSKINRSRIKAIPKLSLRKTSCSASESEDETRKYSRIRNNSVCSVASTTYLEPPTPTSESGPAKEATPVLPKKINRTEQSRKLAEARRDFFRRFGTNMPDKQKLKMIDLIFYNPTSNPMSQKPNNKTEENSDVKEKEMEEQVDDPTTPNLPEEKEKENDADNSMPVPQIKIGPSGEIILDEQSLIVENTEVAKIKEQIWNSQVVDGNFDTGYGIYKRVARSHSWSQKETLRFYKALNLIGTDFTVMTQLFPKRNRRELKVKFKKEEKINRHLIDKAIMQPCMYNFLDLKREVEIEEEEEAFWQKLKEEEDKKMKEDQKTKQEQLDAKRRRKRKMKDPQTEENVAGDIEADTLPKPKVKKSLNINDVIEDEAVEKPSKPKVKKSFNNNDVIEDEAVEKPSKPKVKKSFNINDVIEDEAVEKPSKPKVKKSLNINSVIQDADDDADISDLNQSDSDEEEIIPFLKPTRSGRMPKSTLKFVEPDKPPKTQRKRSIKKFEKSKPQITQKAPSRETPPSRLPAGALRTRRLSSTSSIESNSDRLVPGAVVITTEEGANGQNEYKVFMVTPDRKLTPLQLDSDVVAKLVKEKQCAEFPITPEQNVTIPATEDNSSVKKEEMS